MSSLSLAAACSAWTLLAAQRNIALPIGRVCGGGVAGGTPGVPRSCCAPLFTHAIGVTLVTAALGASHSFLGAFASPTKPLPGLTPARGCKLLVDRSLPPGANPKHRGRRRVGRWSTESTENVARQHLDRGGGWQRRTRLGRALPRGDALDRRIARIALPSAANLLILPLVGAVDTYWVGRMGNALALAGQGAANQVFSSIFWVIAFLPSVMTPLVAEAAASGDQSEARRRICEASFLAAAMGIAGAALLGLCTPLALRLVLAPGAPAEAYALPYLRIRALSFAPALLSTVGFASFRGVMDTMTPLRVATFSNLLNVLMDPVLMFWAGLGVAGAAAATVLAEVASGAIYATLLFRRQLMSRRSLFRVPSLRRLSPLLRGGAAVQLRSLALNAAFVAATRHAQAMDSMGVSAAAYAISMQFWQLGGVALFALQSSAAVLVPAEMARKGGGPEAARAVADRLLFLGLGLGVLVACLQLCTLPLLATFSTLPSVRSAAVTPVSIASFMSVIAGVVFAGEGIMMGRGAWGSLARLAGVSCLTMFLGIQLTTRLNLGLAGLWVSIVAFNLVNLAGVLWHHLVATPRREAGEAAASEGPGAPHSPEAEGVA